MRRGKILILIGLILAIGTTAAVYVVVQGFDQAETTEFEQVVVAKQPTEDAAWCWFSDPRAIYYNGKTYVAWISSIGQPDVASFTHATGTWSRAYALRDADEVEPDDHGNPAILIRDSDHKILLFYSGHVSSWFELRISSNAEDVTSFAAAIDLDADIGGNGYTYAIPIQLLDEAHDPIWLLYRGRDTVDFAGYYWGYTKSIDNGANWAAQTILWQTGGQAYMKAVKNGEDRIDFAVNDDNPNNGATSIYHFYYQGGSWYTSAGADMGAPPFDVRDPTLVYNGSVTKGWVWDIALDASANPVIAYATFPSTTDHRYHVTRWTGAAWDSDQVCTAGTHLYDKQGYYSGGIYLYHGNVNVAYASREIGGRWELYQYTYSGGVWSVTDTLTYDSLHRNIRPMVPYNADSDDHVLWLYGDYTTFRDYDMAVRYRER